jgi:hypothetical protein
MVVQKLRQLFAQTFVGLGLVAAQHGALEELVLDLLRKTAPQVERGLAEDLGDSVRAQAQRHVVLLLRPRRIRRRPFNVRWIVNAVLCRGARHCVSMLPAGELKKSPGEAGGGRLPEVGLLALTLLSALAGLLLSALLSRLLPALAGLLPRLLLAAAALLAALTATLILLVGALLVRIHHLLHALPAMRRQRARARSVPTSRRARPRRWSPIVPTQACSTRHCFAASRDSRRVLACASWFTTVSAMRVSVSSVATRGPTGVVLLRCSRRRTAMERRPAQRVCPAWLGLGDKNPMV